MSAPKDPEKYKLWKENLSKAHKGKKRPDVSKMNKQRTGKNNPNFGRTGEKHPMFGLIGKNHPAYGKHRTQKSKDKMSERQKGEKAYWYGKKRPDIAERMKGKNHPNYGKCLSQVTRDNISKSLKGKMIGEKNPMFGKKRPDRTELNKQQTGEKHPFFGKKRPNITKRMSGKNNPNYIHGKYLEPYTIEFNRKLKQFVRKRDGYKC